MDSMTQWLALLCAGIFGGFLILAIRAVRSPLEKDRPVEGVAWEARAFEESTGGAVPSARPAVSSLGLATGLEKDSLYASEGKRGAGAPSAVEHAGGRASRSAGRERAAEKSLGEDDLPGADRRTEAAKPKLKTNTSLRSASSGGHSGGAAIGGGDFPRAGRRASEESAYASSSEDGASRQEESGDESRGYRKLKAREGLGGRKIRDGGRASFGAGGSSSGVSEGGRRAARGRFGNAIAGEGGGAGEGGMGRSERAAADKKGAAGGGPGDGAVMYGANGAEYQVKDCPGGTRQVPNEGGATCVTLAKGVDGEQPGIFQPTGDPKVPYQNLAGCPGGMQAVVTNQPGPGDMQCVAAGQGPRVGDVMGGGFGFGFGGDGGDFGSGISFRQK